MMKRWKKEMATKNDNSSLWKASFTEIVPPANDDSDVPTYIEAYVASVEPQECGALVKRLSHEMPLRGQAPNAVDLSHLKRVKRLCNADGAKPITNGETDETV